MQGCGVLRGSKLDAMENVAAFDSLYGAQGISDYEVVPLGWLSN